MIVLVVAIALGAGVAAAQPVDHAARGAELFADGKLDEAVAELEAAYRDDPDPNILFALGRVHSARHDCARAVDHYQRYLASAPGQKGADAARAEIDKCELLPEPPRTPAPAKPPRAARSSPRRHGFAGSMIRDRFVQLGLGTGAVAIGTYVYAWHLACWGGECTGNYDDYVRAKERAPQFATAALVLGAVAGGLIITGAVRYTMHKDPPVEAALAPTAGGGSIVVSGRF